MLNDIAAGDDGDDMMETAQHFIKVSIEAIAAIISNHDNECK